MDQGWQYIKLDGLRHLRYEGYNANRSLLRAEEDRSGRRLPELRPDRPRDVIGRDTFLLGCWGIRPELVGLIDACRIGDDGFAYAGLSQYNSFNNVVWRNDPDHIELNDDGYRSTLVTTLTGSLLMLTDKPAVYRTAAIEPARRHGPRALHPARPDLRRRSVALGPARPGRHRSQRQRAAPLRRRLHAGLFPLRPRDRPAVRELARPRPDGRRFHRRSASPTWASTRPGNISSSNSGRSACWEASRGSFRPRRRSIPNSAPRPSSSASGRPSPSSWPRAGTSPAAASDLVDVRWDGAALSGKSRGGQGRSLHPLYKRAAGIRLRQDDRRGRQGRKDRARGSVDQGHPGPGGRRSHFLVGRIPGP